MFTRSSLLNSFLINKSRKILIWISLAVFASTAWAEERRYTYLENDGIYMYYETQNADAYRKLLPQAFDMPSKLTVYTFVSDFYKMDAQTQPYKEAAIFLLANYEGKEVWHCVFMPVTSQESMIVGSRRFGLPKTMGDISFERNSPIFEANAETRESFVMSLTVDTQAYAFDDEERQYLDHLSALPKVSLLNGDVIQMGRATKRSILDLAKMLNKKLTLKAGKGEITFKQPSTKSAHEIHPLDLAPSRVLASYYLKNTIPFRLNGRPIK